MDRTSDRVATAVAVAVLLAIPSPLTRVAASFLAIGVLPGLVVSSRFPRDAVFGVAAALSPVIFGALALLALFAGASPVVAGRASAAIGLAAFVALATRPPAAASQVERRALGLAAVVTLIAATMALTLPLTDAWWRWREDSWFHAAVAEKLVRDGLPLTDPYFAGLRLQYPYFYHAILVAAAALSGLDFPHTMILMNAIALASCAFAFHALSGLFSRRVGPRVLGLCVWLFAMNGWFYLFYPLRLFRALVGRTRGPEMLHQFFPWTPPGHATAVRLIAVEGNQFMFLDKFMIGTAFSLTFGLAATLLYLLVCARRGAWSARHEAGFASCIAGALLLHPVTGFTLVIATAVVLGFLLAIRAQPTRGGPPYARLAGWVILAVAATTPYLLSVAPRDGGESLRLRLQLAQVVGLAADVLPALALAVAFFHRAGSHRDSSETLGARPFSELSLSATGMLLMWTAVVLVAALTVDLVANNETKFAFLLQLPLAAFSVGALERAWSNRRARRVAVAAVASATLPLHLLYFHQAVRDPSALEISGPERAAYAWIREHTPRDAVFIEWGEGARIPVLASRDLYWGNEAYARNWGYAPEEIAARRRLRDDFLSPENLARLRGLGRPVFVVSDTTGMIDSPTRSDLGLPIRRRFTAGSISVWELIGE